MKFIKDECGVALSEYVIIVLILATIVTGTMVATGSSISDLYSGVNDTIAKVGQVYYTFTMETYERLNRNNVAFPDLVGLNEYIVDEESFKDYQFLVNGEAVCVKFDGWGNSSVIDVPECDTSESFRQTYLRLEEDKNTGEWQIVINPRNYKVDENCTDYSKCYIPEFEFEVVNRD